MSRPPIAQIEHTNPNHMLDSLSRKMGIEDDRILARELKLSERLIAMMREGRISVSASMLMRLHEASGLSVEELRRLLTSDHGKYRLTCK